MTHEEKEKKTPDPELTFATLMNPRMSAGLVVLQSLLWDLKGNPEEPREVRKSELLKKYELQQKRPVSKQSLSNAARRLEDAHLIDRVDNKYTVNYGYLLSVLLNTIIEMTHRIDDLEDEIIALKIVDQ